MKLANIFTIIAISAIVCVSAKKGATGPRIGVRTEACAKVVKDLKRGLAPECGEGEKVAAYYVAGGDCENLELGSPVDTKNLNALPWWTGGCSEENAEDNNVIQKCMICGNRTAGVTKVFDMTMEFTRTCQDGQLVNVDCKEN